jgi:peptidoglycan/xylan/chitin deacetylase (PgdA/CDA1 family)
MSCSMQLLKYRFAISIFAALLVSVCISGVAIVSNRNSPFAQSILVTNETLESFPATATPVAGGFQSELPAAPIQLHMNTPAAPTSTSQEWSPLPPILDGYRGLITNGDRSEYKVALTFDVCQREGDLAGYDAAIVRILNETQTPATFFLGGEWMRDHQANALDLAGNPLFELGNHSWSHRDFSAITPEEMRSEILLTQQIMYELLGYQTNLFRLPYGTYNEEALNVINENGLYVIQWDIVSGDPDPNIDAQRMTNGVLEHLQPGSIIIMHANGRGWHTAEALPGIIQSIREQGYTLVTVSDLLKIQPYK